MPLGCQPWTCHQCLEGQPLDLGLNARSQGKDPCLRDSCPESVIRTVLRIETPQVQPLKTDVSYQKHTLQGPKLT